MSASGGDFSERFRASEQRLQDILDSAPAVVCLKDLEGRYLLINRCYEELHHLSRTEVVSKTDHDIFPKEVADKFRTNDEMVLESGNTVEVEESVTREDRTRIFSSLKFPLRDAEETTYAVGCISTDITARMRAEEEIETRSNQQAAVAELGLRALSANDLQSLMDDAVVFVARTLKADYSKVVELLPGGTELLLRAGVGWREGLVGHATEEAGHGSQAGYTLLSEEPVVIGDLSTEKRFRPPPLLEEHGVVAGVTVVIHGQDRQWGVLGAHTRSSRIFSDDDINFLQVVANVLAAAIEREQAEEDLLKVREAEQKRLGRDLHDGALQDLSYGLVELEVARMDLEDPESAAALGRAAEAFRRVSRGVRAAIHDLRQGEEKNRPLSQLVESLVERMREMNPGCVIRLDVQEEFPSGLVVGSTVGTKAGAGTELLRLIGEALTNARRHSGATNVRVRLRVEGDHMVAEVSDDGRGFGAETGSGVGLASMRERALRLGGALVVESEPGEGTRVRLRVPMGEVSQEASRDKPRELG